MNKRYDVVIIGTGLVGSSLALALIKHQLRVALVEQRPLPVQPPVERGASKPIALNYASVAILKNLGLWSKVAAQASPIQTVHISEQGALASTQIQAHAMGVAALGQTVPAAQLGWALTQSLQQALTQGKLDIWNPAVCQRLSAHPRGWAVTIQTETTQQIIEATLVIATDGAGSTTRQLMGIPVQKEKILSSHQQALVTTLHTTQPHNQIAYQRFTQQGILAFLPLVNKNRVGFVWTASAAVIESLTQLNDAAFLSQVQSLFPKRLGTFCAKEALQTHPLEMFMAKPQAQPGFILLGNAAHTLLPIAAQGLNLALHDMAVLVDQILTAREANQPLSHPSLSEHYLKQRLPAQQRIMTFTQRLAKMVSPRVQSLTLLRNSGLLVFDLIPPFKKVVSRRLMGIQGRLPTLIRGTVSYQQEETYAEI